MTEETAAKTIDDRAEVLFVDLDGTLIQTDLLWESLFDLLRREPGCALLVPLWVLRGRSAIKDEVARRSPARADRLPYNPALLDLIEERRASGCRVVLATASPRPWADAVAGHLGVFDAVLATEPGRNLKGAEKLAAIRSYCAGAGLERFDYAGDAPADLPIWREANRAILVGAGPGLAGRLGSIAPGVPVESVGAPRRPLRAALKALRPHQWAKNLLLYVPLVTGQRLFEAVTFLKATVAFLAFCGCASAIYLINDLVDLASDRAHHEKRRRPFASGALPLVWGPPMAAALLTGSFALSAATLPWRFVAILTVYLVLTTLYSLVIKSRLMLDVLALSLLYSIRILAGGAAVEIPISEWLIAFSMFFFLSLAFIKRYTELRRAIDAGRTEKLRGRGYQPSDIGLIESLGVSSGYMAVLVLSLYIQSDAVQLLYRSPNWLWGIWLVLMYWISRLWFLAKRDELPGDPVSFALRDRHSLVAGGLMAAFLTAGALLPWP